MRVVLISKTNGSAMKSVGIMLLVSAALVWTTSASEISYASLTNIVREARIVIKGRVVSVDRRDTANAKRIEYVVAPIAALRGPSALPEQIRLVYAEFSPDIKNEKGEVIGWASPIYTGSGHEFSVKTDQEWLFLLASDEPAKTKPMPLLRVEPVANEAALRELLNDLAFAPSPVCSQPAVSAPNRRKDKSVSREYEIVAVVSGIEPLRTRREKVRITFDVIEGPAKVRTPFTIVFYPDNGQTRDGHFPELARLRPRDKCRLSYRDGKLVKVEILDDSPKKPVQEPSPHRP